MSDDFLSTLFVGIDVSSKSNTVCALDFKGNKLLNLNVANNRPGAESILENIVACLNIHRLEFVVIALESTSFYSIHIANFLSSDNRLFPFHPFVYCLNPKTISNHRKSFVDMDKTDPLDAYVIADFARCGKISSSPWRGSQFLALRRLTRHRFHLVQLMSREKVYMVSNVFLKFSELAVLNKKDMPFSNKYGATSKAVLTEFFSPDDIVYSSVDDLVEFIKKKGKNKFSDPVNIAISFSLNVIKALENEIKLVDKAIEKTIKGLNPNEYICLISIPGIGPVIAAGIIAEMGSVSFFNSNNSLAKFAGLTWRQKQSGNYTSKITRLTKTGNCYLRYYLFEAANSVIRYIPEYKKYYLKKFKEPANYPHKRALVFTTRKLVRLIFGLLAQNRIYVNY